MSYVLGACYYETNHSFLVVLVEQFYVSGMRKILHKWT